MSWSKASSAPPLSAARMVCNVGVRGKAFSQVLPPVKRGRWSDLADRIEKLGARERGTGGRRQAEAGLVREAVSAARGSGTRRPGSRPRRRVKR